MQLQIYTEELAERVLRLDLSAEEDWIDVVTRDDDGNIHLHLVRFTADGQLMRYAGLQGSGFVTDFGGYIRVVHEGD